MKVKGALNVNLSANLTRLKEQIMYKIAEKMIYVLIRIK